MRIIQDLKQARDFKYPDLLKTMSVLILLSLAIQTAFADEDDDFTMQIGDAFAITGKGTVLTGQIATGVVSVGDTICIPLTSGETLPRELKGIERFRDLLEKAEAGQIVGLLVEDVDRKLVAKGEFVDSDCELPSEE